MDSAHIFKELDFNCTSYDGADLPVHAPRDGMQLATLRISTSADVAATLTRAHAAFMTWRSVPPPLRGELVRVLGEVLRGAKERLGRLVSVETGKILSEGLGEVQEMIDICDFAVGLSRQLHGLTIASERRGHRMMETWHPLGVCGVITAFNFPVAVWAWNAALALVCGDAIVWKPSEKTPLSAIAVQSLFAEAVARFSVHHAGCVPAGLCQLLIGPAEVGAALAASPLVALVSATGSTAMGRHVAATVAERLGRSLLELGGNNGMIVTPSADLALATQAVTFSAVGTAGQRCTSLRRLFVHSSLHASLMRRLEHVYSTICVGDPLAEGTLVGPLIDGAAYAAMQATLSRAREEGGYVIGGERVTAGVQASCASLQASAFASAYYVRPALVRMPRQSPIVHRETFAPILYVMSYEKFDDVIALHNAVPQGLSSAIFTNDLREAEHFISGSGSDCGLANINIGTSGAEIGGAFGGEKETGGGRESGSDAWKTYMRRATNTINYSGSLPLAQGVRFDV